MSMKALRIYIDASVFGGCFDEPFREDSKRLFDNVRQGKLIAVTGELVEAELVAAPRRVRELLEGLPAEHMEIVEYDTEVEILSQAYLRAKILTNRSMNDAGHVASATIARVDAIVSWNFKHIVRLEKIKQYNQVNLMHGYGVLTITSPKEVLPHED